MHKRQHYNYTRVVDIVLVFALLSTLIQLLRVTGQEFCGHSIVDEAENRRIQVDSGHGTRVTRSATPLGSMSNRPRKHRASRSHELESQPNQYHEEHHVIIDDGADMSVGLPAEHREIQLTADARVSQTSVRGGANCGGRLARTKPDHQKQARIDNNRLMSTAQPDECDQKTIETAVFVDQALDNKFNGLSNGLVELNRLVLTIMNQVQHLFRYSSLKVPIKIKLVLVEHMRDSERQGIAAPNPERGDIDAYLSNFCNWQQSRLERERRIWWDHAILLSGLDLYKATPGKNHSGVLGLAWVGGMCKGNYSCTINEASNLESAFVIAHEIGHSLGIMHDGQRNNCDPNGFIMSERTGAGKVHWSRCSNNYLNDSINRRQLTCLDSEQNSSNEPLYDLSKLRMPGQVYSINDQCKLAFGSNHTSFVTRTSPFNGVCRELWCVAGNWAKAAHPALEGSSCGDQDRICLDGKCAKYNSQN